MAGVIKVVQASAQLVLPTAVVPQKPTPRPTPAAPPGDALGAQAVGYGTFRDAAARNGKDCVQVHGGMGFTWEVDAHLYLKRAWVLETVFGSADAHAEAVAALL